MFQDHNSIFQFRGPFGVPVHIGSSILVLAFLFVGLGASADVLPYQIAFLAMIVVSIFLHEMGHAWGCIVQGIPVEKIMIHGGGGFCQPARAASVYQDEFIVAMGPIVNLALWAIASLALPYIADPTIYWGVATFAWLNLMLTLFNLVPVMPLDGGRLFQYILMRFIPQRAAIKVAGGVGVVMAIAWIPLMIWFYINIGFLLLFFPPLRLHWRMLNS